VSLFLGETVCARLFGYGFAHVKKLKLLKQFFFPSPSAFLTPRSCEFVRFTASYAALRPLKTGYPSSANVRPKFTAIYVCSNVAKRISVDAECISIVCDYRASPSGILQHCPDLLAGFEYCSYLAPQEVRK